MRALDNIKTISEPEKRMLLELKTAIARFDSGAELVLYGSAARGSRLPDSDYDVLVLTSRKLSSQEERELDRAVYDLQLEHGVVLSVMAFAKDEWQKPLFKASPYRKRIMREGILL